MQFPKSIIAHSATPSVSWRWIVRTLTALALAAPLFAQPAGTITTVAGSGAAGFSGDGGKATNASLGGPAGLAVDKDGQLYICDQGNLRVRKVDANGIITTVAGGAIGTLGDGGPATKAVIGCGSVAFDGAGNMYIAGGTQIRKVDTKGIISTIAGSPTNPTTSSGDGASALQAGFFVTDAAVDNSGVVYLCDSVNNRIRKIDLNGIITTVAGTGASGFSGDNGQAIKATLALPQGIAVDNKGNFFFADSANARIRKVDKNGIITTVAGSGSSLSLPFQDGGPAIKAGMIPTWVTVDKAGNLFIADTGGNKIRKVDTNGTITTFAGGGGIVPGLQGFSGDGGPATKAQLNQPHCVIVDSVGNAYITDTLNNRIRKVSSGITVTAGGPNFTASGVVNGASFASGGIVPGEIATIFGTNLTSHAGINLASTLPLPKDFLNVSVTVNGTPAAIFAVDNVNGQEQINFQVPWEVAGHGSADIQIVNNGAASTSVTVPVLNAQPAVFSYSAGGVTYGAILHANYQLADTAHPAKAGETVLIYCTGLGEVTPVPADGAAAKGEKTIAHVTVSFGGLIALLDFTGLAPGFVGLYQINAIVPAGLTSGNHPVMIIIGATVSNTVMLPIE